MAETFRSYRNGLSGDHNFGLGIGMSSSTPGAPVTVLIGTPEFNAVAETVTPLLERVETVRRKREFAVSGMICKSLMPAGSIGSSQTGCQMPLEEVYMMPPGKSVCLPRGS